MKHCFANVPCVYIVQCNVRTCTTNTVQKSRKLVQCMHRILYNVGFIIRVTKQFLLEENARQPIQGHRPSGRREVTPGPPPSLPKPLLHKLHVNLRISAIDLVKPYCNTCFWLDTAQKITRSSTRYSTNVDHRDYTNILIGTQGRGSGAE